MKTLTWQMMQKETPSKVIQGSYKGQGGDTCNCGGGDYGGG